MVANAAKTPRPANHDALLGVGELVVQQYLSARDAFGPDAGGQ
jgi:hypothetical protein